MEIVQGTTHTHPQHGDVRIESICRKYGVFETETGDGHIPGGWFVQFETDGGELHFEPIEVFTE